MALPLTAYESERMQYESDFKRCQMAEALQAQAQFCDELAGACFDESRAEELKRSADRHRTAASKILAD
jgi:hypothetical protein